MSNCEIEKNGLKFNLSGDFLRSLGSGLRDASNSGAHQARRNQGCESIAPMCHLVQGSAMMAKSNKGRACNESLLAKDRTESNTKDVGSVSLGASSIRHPGSYASEQATPLRLYQAKNFLPQQLPRLQDLGTRSLRERLETENAELRNTLVNLAIELQVLRHGDEA